METTTIINDLIWVAFGLLILVSGGVIYLTMIEWRNRRLQDKDKKTGR